MLILLSTYYIMMTCKAKSVSIVLMNKSANANKNTNAVVEEIKVKLHFKWFQDGGISEVVKME